jgi:hypothetical protein
MTPQRPPMPLMARLGTAAFLTLTSGCSDNESGLLIDLPYCSPHVRDSSLEASQGPYVTPAESLTIDELGANYPMIYIPWNL